MKLIVRGSPTKWSSLEEARSPTELFPSSSPTELPLPTTLDKLTTTNHNGKDQILTNYDKKDQTWKVFWWSRNVAGAFTFIFKNFVCLNQCPRPT